MKSEILFDGVRSVEDFTVTRHDKQESTQRLQYSPTTTSLSRSYNSFVTHYKSYQWRSKALSGPGSTVIWGPSIPSARPKGLKLEARNAESGGGALGREVLLPGLGSGVSRQRQGF